MGATKLQLFDLEEEYRIFAVHTALPGFRLAFLFNQICEAKFVINHSARPTDTNAHASFFEYEDEEHQVVWKLIENRFEMIQVAENASLFSAEPTPQLHYLIPEYKKANFLLKLEGETLDDTPQLWLNRLKSSLHIQSTYEIPLDKIKKNSKKNLIF